MSYSESRFKRHYTRAVEIRLGGPDKAKGSPQLDAVDEAWKAYEKTRTAPLGLQVFGRHKKNPSDLSGEPGIELSGEVFPKVEKMRCLGLWRGRESKTERDARVKAVGFDQQLKHPTHDQRNKFPVEFNFGVASDKSTGSILMMGQCWNLTVNDAWLLGGVHSQQPFYLAFRKTYKNLFNDSGKHNLTITGRELLGLLLAGYSLHENEDMGDVMVCRDPGMADKLTLVKYAVAAQQYEDPLRGKEPLAEAYKNSPNKLEDDPDLKKEMEDAIKETENLREKYVALARAADFNPE